MQIVERRGLAGRDDELLRKLAKLGRAGVWTETGQQSTAAVSLMREVAGVPQRIGALSADEWTYAIEAGWVETEHDGRWRLAKKARGELRKLRSGPAVNSRGDRRRSAGPAAERPQVNAAESPLAWLRQRRDRSGHALISEPQFEAGERLRTDFWLAQMTPRVTTNWSAAAPAASARRMAPGAGLELSDRVLAARERVHRALSVVGPELAGVLIDVCCHLKGLEDTERQSGWPQRSGKVVLQIALTRLARHYGLDRPVRPEGVRSRIHHWGSEDFRPTIDGGAT